MILNLQWGKEVKLFIDEIMFSICKIKENLQTITTKNRLWQGFWIKEEKNVQKSISHISKQLKKI